MLILIRGIPGSGKSTFAKDLMTVSPLQFFHYENDMFLYNENSEYIWSQKRIAMANNKCFQATKKALELNHNVIVSNCFVKNKSIKRYFDLVNPENCFIIEMCGDYGSIHGLDKLTMENIKNSYEPLSEKLKQRKITYGATVYFEKLAEISRIICEKV